MADVGSANVNITADDSDARGTVGGFFGFLKSSASSITGVIGGLAIFDTIKTGITGAFKSTILANAEMETYQNTLAVVMKDSKKAAETLDWAAKFAAQTPFEIPDIVEATTRLTTYGIKAKDVMGNVGDMASVMGKPLMQAVEAVADAQTGELERLKEFGITKQMLIDQAQKMGLGEIVNAKGQITNQQALNKAMFQLMEDRYKGGMALQAKTFNGLISNVKDAMGTIGRELSKPLFDKLKSGLQTVVPIMSAATQALKGDWAGAQQTLGGAFSPETAKKIELFFLKISAGVNKAKQIITDMKPTVQNMISIFNNVKPLLIDIGKAIAGAFMVLMDVLPPILEQITSIIEAFTGWEGFIPSISGVGAAVASLHGMMALLTKAQAFYDSVVAAGTLIQGAWTAAVAASAAAGGGLKGVLAGMRAAAVALNLTMLANPFVLIAALLIGLGVALFQAYKHSETFRNGVNAAWASIKVGFAAVINWFTVTVPAWVNGLISHFSGLWSWIKTFFGQWGSTILAVLVPFIGIPLLIYQHFGQIKAFFSGLWGGVVSGFRTFTGFMLTILQPFITYFVSSWNNLKLLVLSIVTGFFSLLTGDFQGMKLALTGIVTALKNQLVAIWTLLKTTVIAVVVALVNLAISTFNSLKTGAINIVKSLTTGAVNLFTNMKTGSINAVKSLTTAVVNGFISAKNSAVSAVTGMYHAVVSWFQKVPGKATEMKNGMVNILKGINLTQLGKDAIQGFINGVGSMASGLWKKTKEITEGLKTRLEKALKIGSPSKLFEQYGSWTFEGFINGADSMIGGIKNVAAKAAAAIIPDLPSFDFSGAARSARVAAPGLATAAAGLQPEIHNHYWNVDADQINEVSKLVRMVNGLRQDGRRS